MIEKQLEKDIKETPNASTFAAESWSTSIDDPREKFEREREKRLNALIEKSKKFKSDTSNEALDDPRERFNALNNNEAKENHPFYIHILIVVAIFAIMYLVAPNT